MRFFRAVFAFLAVVFAVSLFVLAPLSAQASPGIRLIGFQNTPLTPGSNAGPKAVLTDVDTSYSVRYRIYRKVRFWRDKIERDITTPVPEAGPEVTVIKLWCPDSPTSYRLKVDLIDSNGSVVATRDSDEYYEVSYTDYNWIGHLVNGFFAAKNMAGDKDGDGEANTEEDVFLFLKDAYADGKKYLFYFSFDLSVSTDFGWGTANGGLFSMDLADYYGLTEEGQDGFVSTWLVARSFAGFTPLLTSYGMGVIPISFLPGKEDAREDMALYTYSANLQLLTAQAQLDARGSVKATVLGADSSELAKDFSIGLHYNPQVELEIKRTQLNAMLGRTIFDVPSLATIGYAFRNVDDASLSINFANSVRKMIDQYNNSETIQQARDITLGDDGSDRRQVSFLPQDIRPEWAKVEITPGYETPMKVTVVGGPLSKPGSIIKTGADEYDWYSEPAGALDFSDGVLKWNTASSSSIDAEGGVRSLDVSTPETAKLILQRGLKTAVVEVNQPGYVPTDPAVDYDLDLSDVPRNPITYTTSNVRVTVTAGGVAATDASVLWRITSDGVSIRNGSMVHTGGGVYEADIRWPDAKGLCNFVVSATKGSDTNRASQVISFYPPNPDYGPTLVRKYPDRDIETNGDKRLDFKVVARTEYSTLERIEWYYDGMLVSDQTKTFHHSERYEGAAEFNITPARQTYDYRTSVRAKVYREDGEYETMFWSINVLSNEKPVVTKVEPNTSEVIVVPLGAAGRTTFTANVSDLDDDSRELLWFVNGERVDDDSVGGGNPSSDESHDHIFSEVGDYVVEAYVMDKRGNVGTASWNVHAGVQIEGNTPPDGLIEPPNGLTWDATFREGYRYDFDFVCTDVDGNLAYAAVFIDDEQNWCSWYDGSDPMRPYTDDALQGYSDKANIYDIVFMEPGEHELKLFIRDGSGAENTISKTITVGEADEGSSVAPVILKQYPSAFSSLYVQSGGDIDFEFLFKDPDGDMETLRTYIDGVEYESTGSGVGDTACTIEETVESIPAGTHTLYFKMFDVAGNSVQSSTYTVYAGSTGNHSPAYESDMPSSAGVIRASGQDVRIRIRMRASDPDGDLSHALFFNTAGPLDDVDGTENGKDYDKKAWSSSGETYVNEDFRFNVEQSGTITCKLYDLQGHFVTKSWQVVYSEALDTGSAPVIGISTVEEGEVFNLKDSGEMLVFFADITDPDGDLERVEAWKNGVMVDSYAIASTVGNAAVLFECGDITVEEDNDSGYRESKRPVTFKVYDKAGNVTERNAFYSMGPWNHTPAYPDAPVRFTTDEDSGIVILPTIPDEDGDIVRATVKTQPQHGTVSGEATALEYTPNKDFAGEDTLVLSCDDGYDGTSDVTINITVEPMNDSPVVVNAEGVQANQLRVEVMPGQSYNLTDLISGLDLDDPDGELAIGSSTLTILSESSELNVGGAPVTSSQVRKASTNAVVVAPDVSGESQFLSVAFLDEEGRPSTPLTLTFVTPDDTDGDGIADTWEMERFGDLTTATAVSDFDGDGLSDKAEYLNSTNPKLKDTEGDGMWDGWEVQYSLNPLVDDADDHADSDDATNLEEFEAGTDPTDGGDFPSSSSTNSTSSLTPVYLLLLQ